MILADISFSDVLWSMIVFFFFIIFLWMIFGIITDIFRSDDLSGGAKALWCIFLIFFPWLMIFVYLIVRGRGMSGRMAKSQQEAQQQFDDYVRQTAGDVVGGGGDHVGQGSARQWGHQPGRVRADQAAGIGVELMAAAAATPDGDLRRHPRRET